MIPRENNYGASLSKSINNFALDIDDEKNLNRLIDKIGNCRLVLLGEASHGTHEYYAWRARISKRLIEEKGFSFIAVEGDWPDCYRLNRYIKNYPDAGESAVEVLHQFNRWPTWMWANWEISALAEYLRTRNAGLSLEKRTGFFGLDVYSLWESLEAIVKYLEKKHPASLEPAWLALKCFQPYADGEGQEYARATAGMVPASCEAEVVNMLKEIRKNKPYYNTDMETVFSTEQNAWVTVNAERYYRAMIRSDTGSWNIRDIHMAETLHRLMKFHGPDSKAIIWEHNTHIGDARATDMVRDGMVNVGQLVREQYGENNTALIGFGSYQGSVIAGKRWGDVMRKIRVPPAAEGSWEWLIHQSGKGNLLIMSGELRNRNIFRQSIGHRAIGVVYNPEYEQYGNYVPSIIPDRYDAFIFLDETTALHPLHIKPDGHQMPETYPWGV